MEQTVLAIVDDTPDVLKAKLKREWEAIDARKEAGDLDFDVQRARALTIYLGLGLTYKQIAESVGIQRGWLDQILRYGRFMNFASAAADANTYRIAERRFRRYWKETVDKATMAALLGNGRKIKQTPRLEYEQQVFQQILEKHMKGEEGSPEQPQKTNRATRQLTKQIIARFSDGKFHLAGDIATAIGADVTIVRSICDRIVRNGTYQTFGERRPAASLQGSFAYRLVKGGSKKLDLAVFLPEVKPVLDDLDKLATGHHVDFSQQAVKMAVAEIRKVIDRVAR